jgi:hypothetical protein
MAHVAQSNFFLFNLCGQTTIQVARNGLKQSDIENIIVDIFFSKCVIKLVAAIPKI